MKEAYKRKLECSKPVTELQEARRKWEDSQDDSLRETDLEKTGNRSATEGK